MLRKIILLSCFAACACAPGLLPQSDTQRVARLEQIAASYTKDDAFMSAVLVAEGDTVLLNKGYGRAVLEWDIPNAPDVKFRLGSMTKQFTAALILLLVQDGKLNVADPVSKYLPDAPKTWEKITVRSLLSHTSGIPNFTNDAGFRAWSMNPRTPAEELAFFKDKQLEFEPGTKFAYSNSNYEVLGVIVEKVSGKRYVDLLRERILDPLGMHDTGLDADGLVLPKRAEGYMHGPKGLEVAVSESMSVPWAAGGMYSTTADLLTWERGLFGGKVLSAALLKEMITPVRDGYGYGLEIRPEAGTTVVSHAGAIEGFNTEIAYIPDKRITVVALSNVNGSGPVEIGAQMVRVMLGEPVTLTSERKEQAISATELARFVGEVPDRAFVRTDVYGEKWPTDGAGDRPGRDPGVL